jgi:hypothetical protein
MKSLLATFAAVFQITFLAAPTMGAGWFLDTGNAIGFAAFGGLLYLTVTGIGQRPATGNVMGTTPQAGVRH